jgi:hypothetical protein
VISSCFALWFSIVGISFLDHFLEIGHKTMIEKNLRIKLKKIVFDTIDYYSKILILLIYFVT